MIRVGINGRALEKPDPAGVSLYTEHLIRALARRSARGEADILLSVFGVSELPDELAAFDCVSNASRQAPPPTGPRAHLWEQLRLPRAIAGRNLDVFHTPAGHPPVLARVPQVTTIHDVSPVTHPEWFSPGYSTLVRMITPVAIRRSERIITVSEFARDELVGVYPRARPKTTVVYNGVTEPPDPSETVRIPGLDPGYVLSVGSANPRKNLETLLAAYRRYRHRTEDPNPLVLAGPDRNIFADTATSTPDEVYVLGYVSAERLGWLYRNAGAFAFPSLYEGFGLPVLEAMSVGTPVVTGDRGATAEVAGEAAVLVDPEDPDALAMGMSTLLADGSDLASAGQDRAAEFTWDRTAAQTLSAYTAATE